MKIRVLWADDHAVVRGCINNGQGLFGISERVALMGARLNFGNRPNGGLLIQVEVPHPRVIQQEL